MVQRISLLIVNAFNPPKYKSVFLLTWLTVFSELAVSAGITEEDILGDIPLVMAATRLPQSVTDTPVAITVIDRKMIDASGFIEIPDLLRLVPGFQVGLSWRDHHAAVTYHGQSDGLSRRMQVLIDGRVAVGSLFGIVDWDRLGIVIDDIARIEVVRGPAGVAYGSNAFVGAINIVTYEPFANPGWQMSATGGSKGTGLVSAQYSEVGDSFDYRASISYFHTDGFDGVNDETITRSGRFQGRYQLAPNINLDFQFGHSEGPWGRGGSGLSVDTKGSKEATEKYGNFRLTTAISPGNEWYVQFGILKAEEDDKYEIGLLSGLLGVTPAQVSTVVPGQQDQTIIGSIFDYTSHQLDVEFQQLLQWGASHRAVWGGGYRKDRVKGIGTVGKTSWNSMETYRVYGSLEYHLNDKILLNVGSIFEDNDMGAGKFSPRVGINITLMDDHVLRFSVAQSWRQPFLAEQFHDISIRLNDGSILEKVQTAPITLEHEKLRTYEIGYIGYWEKKRFSIEVKAFREEFQNEIEYVYDPFFPEVVSIFNLGAILDINGGATEITGIETGIKWQLNNQTHLWLSYAFSEVDQHCQALGFRCAHENDATPRHTASLLMSHDFGHGWEASVGYYYLDEMAWILWSGDIESYDRVDMRVARTFNIGRSILKLELIGQNLGGDYHEFSQNNLFETRTFVRATLQFH